MSDAMMIVKGGDIVDEIYELEGLAIETLSALNNFQRVLTAFNGIAEETGNAAAMLEKIVCLTGN